VFVYLSPLMATNATLYNLAVQLADVDRGVYETLDLRLARHPSETLDHMLTRALAYCLEYQDGIAFSDGGVSAIDEPAVVVRDLTGRLTAWIEVGAPDADRLHRGSKLAGRAAVYTQRDPVPLLAQLDGTKIHRAAEIPLYSFGRGFIETVARTIERRTKLSLSITERQVYVEVDGRTFATTIAVHRLG
jgi:uncharacterized protein YaeQ